jgi:hypothetical protein
VSDDLGVPIFHRLLCGFLSFEPELFADTDDETDDPPLAVCGFTDFEEGRSRSRHTRKYPR